MNGEIKKLHGLGPTSAKWLNSVGIYTRNDLEVLGSVQAYLKVCQLKDVKPSLNLLYALEGALQGVDWREIAHKEKGRLIMQLESQKEMDALLGSNH